jgi:hypothetical protein
MVGAVGIENNTDRNLKDLEEILGSIRAAGAPRPRRMGAKRLTNCGKAVRTGRSAHGGESLWKSRCDSSRRLGRAAAQAAASERSSSWIPLYSIHDQDENDTRAMAALCQALLRLRDASRAALIVVHEAKSLIACHISWHISNRRFYAAYRKAI